MGLSELTAFTAETWGCSRRQARDVVAKAHKDWLDACYGSEEIDQRDLLFQQVGRLERIARKAENAGQYSAAVGAIAALNRMMALGADQKGFRGHRHNGTTTGVENSDQLGTSQQVSRNEASSGTLKLPKLLAVPPTGSVQSNSSPDGCCNNQKQEEAFHTVSMALTV